MGYKMDKKLEARIARLERMLSHKNEGTDFNMYEKRALHKCMVAKKALQDAIDECDGIDMTRALSGFDWRGIADDLREKMVTFDTLFYNASL